MQQERLFRLAPEAFTYSAFFEGQCGWRLVIQMRRQGEPWSDAYREEYSHLSTGELLDVIEASTSGLFSRP